MTTTLSAAPVLSSRRLHADDLPALRRLHDAVMHALPDPGMFRLFGGPDRFLADHVGARGESLGIFADERLVAYGALTLPGAGDMDNYARDLGWPDARAGRVALLSAAMVEPSHRRRGLHRSLVADRLRRALDRGCPELLVRASPGNTVSRRTLLAHGFAIVWLGVQAEGSLRHVMWRPIEGPAWQASVPEPARTVWVEAEDLGHQQQLLQAGWIGARMREGDAAVGFVQVARKR